MLRVETRQPGKYQLKLKLGNRQTLSNWNRTVRFIDPDLTMSVDFHNVITWYYKSYYTCNHSLGISEYNTLLIQVVT